MIHFSAECPSCEDVLRWNHLLHHPMAPFYFRCKHCKARIRMKNAGLVMMVLAFALAVFVVWILTCLGLAAVAPKLSKLLVLIVTGVVATIAGVVVVLACAFQRGVLVVREHGLMSTPAERSYLLTVVIGLLLLAVVALALGYAVGYASGYFEDMFGRLPH